MYFERREYVGVRIYVTKTYNSGHINPHGLSGRKKKSRETSERQAAYNEKQRIKKLDFLLQLNFNAGDHNITLHYPRGMCPSDERQANMNVGAMLKRLKKRHKDAKYIYCTHSTVNGSIHHHLIISGTVPQIEIEEAWESTVEKARISVGHTLYRDKKSYKKLAAYLVADDKHKPHGKGARAFTGSRNLVKPETQRREIKANAWRKIPAAPRGYRVEGLVNTTDIYGFPYQYYVLVPDIEADESGGLDLDPSDLYG